jgi:ketosteroid isomerase-like protein
MSDNDQILALHHEFISSFAKEDHAAMREVLTEDHVGMAPGRPQMSGRDEAEAFWREGWEVAKSAFTSHNENITVSGDWAIDRFRFVMSIEPRDGSPRVRDEGKCVWVWRKESDGKWRLSSAIWNSDASEPALWSGG